MFSCTFLSFSSFKKRIKKKWLARTLSGSVLFVCPLGCKQWVLKNEISIRCVIVFPPSDLPPPPLLHTTVSNLSAGLRYACKSVHLLSNFKHTDSISLMHWLFLCVEVQIGNDSLLPTALTFMMEHNVKGPTVPFSLAGGGGGILVEDALVIN